MRRSLLALAFIAAAPAACSLPAPLVGSAGAPAGAPAGAQDEWGSQGASGAQESSRHLTLLVGERWLNEDDWHPLDDQFTYGLEVDEYRPATGHGYELGLLEASDDADNVSVPGFGLAQHVDVDTLELYGGYRHTFRADQEGLHPYVSVGLTVMDGELDVDTGAGSSHESDTSMGAYLRVGMLWDVSPRMRLGLDVRRVLADDWEVGNVDADADYDQALLTLGWAF